MRWFRGGTAGFVICAPVLAMVTVACGEDCCDEEDAAHFALVDREDEAFELQKLRNRLNVLEQRRNEAATPTTSVVTGRADGSSLTAEFSAVVDGCGFHGGGQPHRLEGPTGS